MPKAKNQDKLAGQMLSNHSNCLLGSSPQLNIDIIFFCLISSKLLWQVVVTLKNKSNIEMTEMLQVLI